MNNQLRFSATNGSYSQAGPSGHVQMGCCHGTPLTPPVLSWITSTPLPASLFYFSTESVTNVTITSDPVKVFEGNTTVLTCTSAGTSVSYFWLKGNQSLEAAGHISVSNNSQVLTLSPVSRNDSDIYTCYGNNTFSNDSASYKLDVFCKFSFTVQGK